MFNQNPEAGIPTVQFADADLMRKLNLPNAPRPMPDNPQSNVPAPQVGMFDFSQNADSGLPTSMPAHANQPKADFTQMPPDSGLPKEFHKNAAPTTPAATTATPAPTSENPTPQPAASANPFMPSTPQMDGPELSFIHSYTGLTPKQQKIVDDMASKLKFSDLFQNHRFKLKYDIFPGQLRITLVSMNQGEQEDFWKMFRDTTCSKFEIDVLMDLYRCVYTITEINDTPIPPNDRLGLFKDFDNAFIRTLANFSTLFEVAKMKVLYHNFLTIQSV